jgi:hypothetical protein
VSKKGEEAWRLQSQGSPTRMIQGGKMTNHGKFCITCTPLTTSTLVLRGA